MLMHILLVEEDAQDYLTIRQFLDEQSGKSKLEANQTALDMINNSLEQVQNQSIWETAWAKNNRSQFKSAVITAAHGEFIHYELELETQHSNIIMDFSLTPIKNEMGKVLWLLAEGRDLSERKDIEQQLTHATLHDNLTSLPNRQLFFEYLERAMQKLSHSHKRLAVLFIDIDRFRMVNESLGHDMGDWLLMEIAERLQSCIVPDNLLARFGDDGDCRRGGNH